MSEVPVEAGHERLKVIGLGKYLAKMEIHSLEVIENNEEYIQFDQEEVLSV